jgi:transcriptional regulator
MSSAQILPGTLELLVLRAVSLGPLHGYGILRRIEQLSSGALLIEEGALYPALWRLERQRLVTAEWGASDNNRKAKFYSLTRKGKTKLGEHREAWDRLVDAMGLVLGKKEVG